MDKRTEGAWLINHTKKLVEIQDLYEFEDIELAGKCGVFLSNLAASDESSDLNSSIVNAIAQISGIKKTEIDTIKSKLEDSKLIETGNNGSISVLGITTSSVLIHTADIFDNGNPSNFQRAALDIAETISDLPKQGTLLTEYISDTYGLTKSVTSNLILKAEEIGFVDFEPLDNKTKLYFNGNLFRREYTRKTDAILSSLKSDDVSKIATLDQLLSTQGCVPIEKGNSILGDQLLSKLQSIGMYDFNEVSNSQENRLFITKPSAFSKFGNPFEEDALDLAKAFVSSLFYGMTISSRGRGKITMLKLLLSRLVDGNEVGPATAIGEDYKYLELKRVIKIRKENGSNRYYMKLLKKDIGSLALQVLENGDVSEQTVVNSNIYTGNVTSYAGPENIRSIKRKRQNPESKKSVAELLRTFRN